MVNLEKIREIARKKGMSVMTLAKQIDITPQSLYLMIRKNRINSETLEKISNVLNVSPAIFFESKISDSSAQDTADVDILKDNNTEMSELTLMSKIIEEISEHRKLIAETRQMLTNSQDILVGLLTRLVENRKEASGQED